MQTKKWIANQHSQRLKHALSDAGNLLIELTHDGKEPEFAKSLEFFIGDIWDELAKRNRVEEMTDERTAYGNCRQILHSLHRVRKREPLNEHSLRMMEDNLKKWKQYRSNETFDCVRAYGVWEDPVIYEDESEVDEYVLEIIEDLEDDFEWATEPVKMTGRQLGQLTIDW